MPRALRPAQAAGRRTLAKRCLENVEGRHPHAQADLRARLRQALGHSPGIALAREQGSEAMGGQLARRLMATPASAWSTVRKRCAPYQQQAASLPCLLAWLADGCHCLLLWLHRQLRRRQALPAQLTWSSATPATNAFFPASSSTLVRLMAYCCEVCRHHNTR